MNEISTLTNVIIFCTEEETARNYATARGWTATEWSWVNGSAATETPTLFIKAPF